MFKTVDEETGFSGMLDNLGSTFKDIIKTGTELYKTKTEGKIASSRLRTEQIAAEREAASRAALLMAPASMPLAASGGFPVLPVLLGVGALGIVGLLLMKKR